MVLLLFLRKMNKTKDKIEEEMFEVVMIHGKQFKPAILPSEIKRGKMGDCFDVCILNAMNNKKYKYVEGFVRNPKDKDHWIMHAWLTDGEHAFDPTWIALDKRDKKEIPIPTIYVGIEMNTMKVAEFLLEVKYKSVLANGWRNRKLASEILKVKI